MPEHAELLDKSLDDGSVVVYDTSTNLAHALSGEAADTWRADATRSAVDRRATLKRLLALGAGVVSLTVPDPAAAQSIGGGLLFFCRPESATFDSFASSAAEAEADVRGRANEAYRAPAREFARASGGILEEYSIRMTVVVTGPLTIGGGIVGFAATGTVHELCVIVRPV